jgi:hypothetical protein
LKYRKEKETDADGWTHWITPKMFLYRIRCCDCGLVHDVQFQAIQITSRRGEFYRYRELSSRKFQIQFKVRRNVRATAASRRLSKKEAVSG